MDARSLLSKSLDGTILIDPHNHLRRNGQRIWIPGSEFVVDEMMVPFHGFWKWRQFIPRKPHNTGLKFFAACDNRRFFLDFFLYEGQLTSDVDHAVRPSDTVEGFIDRIELAHPDREWIVYADSYYGSLHLAERLHARGIRFVLSCAQHRPKELWSHLQKIKKYEHKSGATTSIAAVAYHDRAIIHLLSNLSPSLESVSNTAGTRQIPWILRKYRDSLGWVDQFDQSLHQYWYQHRNIKWTRALLLALIKIALTNAWIIRRYYHPGENYSYRQFMLNVIDHLAGTTILRERNAPGTKGNTRYDGRNHYPVCTKRQKCDRCNNQQGYDSPIVKCRKCGVRLHIECFELYHIPPRDRH